MTSPLAIWKDQPARPSAGELFAKVKAATHGIGQLHDRASARSMFGRHEQLRKFNARNPMSGATIEIRALKTASEATLVVEISHGEFLGHDLLGITVFDVRLDRDPRDDDLSECVNSPEEVRAKLLALLDA